MLRIKPLPNKLQIFAIIADPSHFPLQGDVGPKAPNFPDLVCWDRYFNSTHQYDKILTSVSAVEVLNRTFQTFWTFTTSRIFSQTFKHSGPHTPFCAFLNHYHLEVQAKPKKWHQKTDAIFSIYGRNGIIPWHFFLNSHLGLSRSLRSNDDRCWILRLWPRNFAIIPESLAPQLEKVR